MPLVQRYGAWSVWWAAEQHEAIGFPPTWGLTGKMKVLLEVRLTQLFSENGEW
jgi:hypothetical protein